MSSDPSPAAEPGVARAFASSDIISESWKLFKASWRAHLALVILANAPWIALLVWQENSPETEWPGATIDPFWAVVGVGAMSLGLASSIRLHLAGEQLAGRRTRLTDSTVSVMRRMYVVWPFWLACATALIVGFGFLVVPGVMFACIFFVATSAQVIEERSPWASLRRSVELTRGRRFEVFGLVITALVMNIAGLVGLFLFDSLFRAVAHHRLKIARNEVASPDEPSARATQR